MENVEPMLPFVKGRKFWIEIEATEDGNFTGPENSEMIKIIFRDTKIGQFQINKLVLFESHFNKQLADDIKDFLASKGLM
jgi:hypothetical protein